MAGKEPSPKEIEKLRKAMKAHIAKVKKAPKVEKSKVAEIGNAVKEERAKLSEGLKALQAAPDA